MQRARLLLALACLLAPVAAEERGEDTLRRDIEFARQQVFPALVNIAVVSKDYTGGRLERFPSAGSGVIVSPAGHVLTNYHVAADAVEITCRLPTNEAIPATVIAHDPLTDLSVLKLTLEKRRNSDSPLPFARLGDSDALKTGDYVLAMGNPLTLSSSMTLGIVGNPSRVFTSFTGSDLDEMDLGGGQVTGLFTRWIQHDALILPGNSGGPLVNLRGEVVGINTAIFSRSGGNMGIGFAIPINMARTVMRDLIDKGRVVRGFLGVVIQGLDEPLAKSFGYQGTDGALVAEVSPGSPAEKAGIMSEDIITRFNGNRVSGPDRFRIEVAAVQPGTTAEVEVFRGGSLRTLEIQVGELPGERASAGAAPTENADANLGASLRTLTPDMARQLGIEEYRGGVVVMGVEPASAADRAGLRPRDAIVAVHDQPVGNLDEFRAALRKHDLKLGVRLKVLGGATARYVFLQLRG
jgi:serine protease Do